MVSVPMVSVLSVLMVNTVNVALVCACLYMYRYGVVNTHV